MPYVDPAERAALDHSIDSLADSIKPPGTSGTFIAGRLNYAISRLMVKTLPEKRYWALALAVGTVVCAVLEFYRRFIAKYEDDAITKHGDIEEYK